MNGIKIFHLILFFYDFSLLSGCIFSVSALFFIFLIVNLILFGIYSFLLLLVFGFMTIVILDINKFRAYSKYLGFVVKVYLILIIVIALFGAYKILTHYTPPKKMVSPPAQLDF